MPEAIITTDRAGNVEFLNQSAEQLTGLRGVAAHGRPVSDVLPVIDETNDQPLIRMVTHCLENGSPTAAFEGVLPSGEGKPSLTVDVSATPIRDPAGTLIGAAIVARDVTHSRLIAKQLSHRVGDGAHPGTFPFCPCGRHAAGVGVGVRRPPCWAPRSHLTPAAI